MEWPWNDWKKNDLQNKIGLIQIASESKIALFHIGLHRGTTSSDIIAPTLRRLLEDPAIGKVGVNVLKADFARLSRFFGLKPKGAIEISHLHRLVKYGPRKPELVSVKMVSLANQVEDQLGLPLYKGDVRTSNWSKPLSKDQINYAAGDAYAGFMLYKCMNAKRLAMIPTPPLPIYAEKYPSGKASRDDPIRLDVGDGTIITTEEFFGVTPAKSGAGGTYTKAPNKTQTDKKNTTPLNHASQALYEELVVRRALLAEKGKTQPARIISDHLLEAIARESPNDTESLLAVHGIGSVSAKKWGDEWLEVISLFLATNGLDQPGITAKPVLKPAIQPPRTPRRLQTRRSASPDSSPAFGTPPRTPQLHTGLSFTLAETNIDTKGHDSDDTTPSYDSDDSLPSLDFGSPSRRRISSGTKRKRTESPTKHNEVRAKTLALQDLTQPDTEPPPAGRTALNAPTIPAKVSIAPPKPLARPPVAPAQDLCLASRIAKSKLLAFSRLVTRKLPPRAANAPPIVTEYTLDAIVKTRPSTQDELKRIPGIDSFLYACESTGSSLIKNVVKFLG
jgi:ribonuclease D